MLAKIKNKNFLNGMTLTFLIALSSFYLAGLPFLKKYGISPLLIAIIIGIYYGNILRPRIPPKWAMGFQFSSKTLLRIAIVLFGFRLTIQDILNLGWGLIASDIIIVSSTIIFGYLVGTRLLKIDKQTSLLCASGAGICGAAAVLSTQSIIRANQAKVAVAMATVVVFGTMAMFMFPPLYTYIELNYNNNQFGIFAGLVIHEVAQVAAVGQMIEVMEIAQTSIIAKMGRVLLLAPVLIILGYWWNRNNDWMDETGQIHHQKPPFPWFAIGFIITAIFNSYIKLPEALTGFIIQLDTFLFAAAMAALEIDTTWERIKTIGPKPFVLGGIIFIWLLVIGYVSVKFLIK